MNWEFRRYFASETFFNDVGVSVNHATKFDLYQGDELNGTVIDYDKKAVCFFRDGEQFSAEENKRILWNSFDFVLTAPNGEKYGVGTVKVGNAFNRNNHLLFFPASDSTYRIERTSRFRPSNGYRQIISFFSTTDNQLGCRISVKVKPGKAWQNALFHYRGYPYEGDIRLADNLPREHVFAFLLLLSRIQDKEMLEK